MHGTTMGKKKIFLPSLRAEDYEVICGQRINARGQYIGELRIRRTADGKVIYPFDGCKVPGPFETAEEARHATRQLAEELVRQDVANPE